MKQILILLIITIIISNCGQKAKEMKTDNEQTDLSTLEKEIQIRLREYESNLRNGDSIALGGLYMEDAEIIPSAVG